MLLSRLTLDIRDVPRSEDGSLLTSGLLSDSTAPDGETTEEVIELDTEVSLWANTASGSDRNATTTATVHPAG